MAVNTRKRRKPIKPLLFFIFFYFFKSYDAVHKSKGRGFAYGSL